MQDKNVMDRLNNPPTIDGRNKEIDLGDMPEDMDYEFYRVAVVDIVKGILAKYENGNVASDSFKHKVANEIFEEFMTQVMPAAVMKNDTEPTTADEFNEYDYQQDMLDRHREMDEQFQKSIHSKDVIKDEEE